MFVAPRPLAPHGRIAVIAPSSPFDTGAFDRGIAKLRERYEVRYEPALLSRAGYLAGDDARRLAEIEDALRDDGVDAIVAARGGYGATRLLEHLDVALIAGNPKLLVGFSDVTALHAAWLRAGVRAIHAPMIAALGDADRARFDRWVAAVEGALPPPVRALERISGGRAEGPLVGGNLAVLCALVGTPYAPPVEGAILFLEDVGERPYRVDRMLTTLRHAGWLSKIAGVALGAFTEGAAGPDGVTVEEVLVERLSTLGIPVAGGVPAGHVDDNLELPLGAPVVLDADAGTLAFLEASTFAP